MGVLAWNAQYQFANNKMLIRWLKKSKLFKLLSCSCSGTTFKRSEKILFNMDCVRLLVLGTYLWKQNLHFRVNSCLSVQEIKMLLLNEPDVTIKLWFKTGIRSRLYLSRHSEYFAVIWISGPLVIKDRCWKALKMHAKFTKIGLCKRLPFLKVKL